MWGPRFDSVHLVQTTPISLWFMVRLNNELGTGANLNQLITGGPHIVGVLWSRLYLMKICHRIYHQYISVLGVLVAQNFIGDPIVTVIIAGFLRDQTKGKLHQIRTFPKPVVDKTLCRNDIQPIKGGRTISHWIVRKLDKFDRVGGWEWSLKGATTNEQLRNEEELHIIVLQWTIRNR